VRLAVLASGTGSTLEALIAAQGDALFGARVVGVVSDRPDARALRLAADAGLPSACVSPTNHAHRAAWDGALTEAVAAFEPAMVVCAGFMRILGPAFLARFDGAVVNTHPALLPAFPGAHAVRDALAHGVKLTGATIHLVDAGIDTGPIIAQVAVDVLEDDDEARLHERIKLRERELLVKTVGRMVREGWSVHGRKVTIP
jgi:phosphoribosylglycinamide formyltransferase 1